MSVDIIDFKYNAWCSKFPELAMWGLWRNHSSIYNRLDILGEINGN